jgi:AraC-like DNA-binding protein
MTLVWRDADQSPAARLDYMRHAVADWIAPFELRPKDRSGSFGEISGANVGVVRVIDLTAPASEAVRGPRLIRRADPELCSVHVQLDGEPVIEQGDRQTRVPPGDLVLLDLSQPTRVAGTAHRFVSLVFPRAMLSIPEREIRELAGVRLAGSRGPGALVAGLARQLTGSLDEFADATCAARIGSAVVDLTAATLASWTGRDAATPPQRRHALLPRIEAFIEQRLADPDLNPGTIASAHHISLRYLHRLFEPRVTTVANLIRTRRLERCRRDLSDPACVEVPVAVIGARWGFRDPAQFSRAFRAAYGVPPGEFRSMATTST